MVVLIFWLTLICVSFGLFAQPGATVAGLARRLRAVGRRSDLPCPGARAAIRRPDADLKRTASPGAFAAELLASTRAVQLLGLVGKLQAGQQADVASRAVFHPGAAYSARAGNC